MAQRLAAGVCSYERSISQLSSSRGIGPEQSPSHGVSFDLEYLTVYDIYH